MPRVSIIIPTNNRVNDIGREDYRIEIVNYLNRCQAKFLGQCTQMRAVNNGDVPTLLQTNCQVAHIHFYSRARGTAEAGNQDSHSFTRSLTQRANSDLFMVLSG
jgi:hypothetical protein